LSINQILIDALLEHSSLNNPPLFHYFSSCLRRLQSFPSLTLFAVLGKPREHFPATTLKPAIKALQDPFTLSRGHSLARCFGNNLATLWSLGASTHAAVVLAPSVGQCLGLARVACASGVGFAGLFYSHLITPSLGFHILICGAYLWGLES
jgi:hypothetical protein